MEPRAPFDGLSEAGRLQERISVFIREIRLLRIILEHGPVLVLSVAILPADYVDQAEEDE